MKRMSLLPAATCIAALAASLLQSAQAGGLERLYILNCGEGTAGDISRWSPGVNVGKAMPFVDNCYLLKHSQGWMIWDTGVADAVATMADGLKPSDPGATHWYRPKTLAGQLEQLGVKTADIKFLAVSHSHPDHIGNVELFPDAMLFVQKAEYEWQDARRQPRFNSSHPVTLLEGDKDVFGDGSVTLISTPGHTPGHQSMLVRLPKTGALLLSGDAVHFRSNWENRVVPAINTGQEQTTASMNRIAGILNEKQATLWINHDKAQRDTLKMSPAYYE